MVPYEADLISNSTDDSLAQGPYPAFHFPLLGVVPYPTVLKFCQLLAEQLRNLRHPTFDAAIDHAKVLMKTWERLQVVQVDPSVVVLDLGSTDPPDPANLRLADWELELS